jgi:hypothetical protein
MDSLTPPDITRMNVVSVGHEARRKRHDVGSALLADENRIETHVPLCIGIIAMLVEIGGDVAGSGSELRIQVNEWDAKPFRECRACGGLASASGTNQLDHSLQLTLSAQRLRMSRAQSRFTRDGSIRVLGTDSNEIARLHSAQSLKHFWRKRSKLSQAIRSSHDDHNRDTGGLNVLLKFNVLIDGEKGLEPFCQHELQ